MDALEAFTLGVAVGMFFFNDEPVGTSEQQHVVAPSRPLNPRHIIPRMVVLDFDYTLLNGKLSDITPSSLSVRERSRLFYDADFLLNFCEKCIAAHHVLRIASHAESSAGSSDVGEEMCLLLNSVLPLRRGYLNDPAHIACWRSSSGKNSHVDQLLECTHRSGEGSFSFYQVVLIDDCESNIRKASQVGYHGFHCDTGFSRQWFSGQIALHHLLGFSL